MYVVVELQGSESLGVKSDWVDFRVVWRNNRENESESIVGDVGFEDDLHVWNPMGQYQIGVEGFFECFEGFPAFWSDIANNPFSSQTCE